MEYAPDDSLADLLNVSYAPAMAEQDVRALLRQCLNAIQHLHSRGIAYGNIRAEAILLHSRRPIQVKPGNFSGANRALTVSSARPPLPPQQRLGQGLSELVNGRSEFASDLRALGWNSSC